MKIILIAAVMLLGVNGSYAQTVMDTLKLQAGNSGATASLVIPIPERATLGADLSAAARLSAYICAPFPGNKNVGDIEIYGDPVKDIYQTVLVSGVSQLIRSGVTSPVYMYLYDPVSKAATLALEVVNYPTVYDGFELSVYGSDHIVVGSYSISRYKCRLAR